MSEFQTTPKLFDKPPFHSLTLEQQLALNCARCIIAQDAIDTRITTSNIVHCAGVDPMTVRAALRKGVVEGLLSEQVADLKLPGHQAKTFEYTPTVTGEVDLYPDIQPGCRLVRNGPPVRFSASQERALRCASCLIAGARERNMAVRDPALHEREAVNVPDIKACVGPDSHLYAAMDTLVEMGYFELKPSAVGKGVLRREPRDYAITELGERRIGVARNPGCSGEEKRALATFEGLSPSLRSMLRCFGCISSTLARDEERSIPGVSASMINTCVGGDPKALQKQLAGLSEAGYIRRVNGESSLRPRRQRHYFEPNPRIQALLRVARRAMPPGDACYSEQLEP